MYVGELGMEFWAPRFVPGLTLAIAGISDVNQKMEHKLPLLK